MEKTLITIGKTLIRKILKTGILPAAILLALTLTLPANAQYYNFGTLDVNPVTNNDSQNPEWLVDSLNPGEQAQQQIQISNFGGTDKQLEIYVTEAEENDSSYFTKEVTPEISYLDKWINLPVDKLTLKAGESRILSVNYSLPANAGTGLHTGAIIVREVADNSRASQTFNIEKGVRIYLSVEGPVVKKGKLNEVTISETASDYGLNLHLENQGTVNFEEKYTAKITGLAGETITESDLETRVFPQTSMIAQITLDKPGFGIYGIHLANANTDSLIKTVLFIPAWSLFAVLLAILLFTFIKEKLALKPLSLSTLKLNFKMPEFQRSAAYIGIFILTATITLSSLHLETSLYKGQLLQETVCCAYDLTVKWGDFRPSVTIPRGTTKDWRGKLFFPNATIYTHNYLHFESKDKAEITENNSTLEFDLLTVNDNDGIVLHVQPLTDAPPYVVYENYTNGETISFPIIDYMSSPGIYPDGLWATQFSTGYCEQEILRQKTMELSALGDMVATPELFATAEMEATPPAGAHIPELENLFVEELPATPDALSAFILESDYVEKTIHDNYTKKLQTDMILLEALEATPDILEEIAATPDLNFIFIPTETITFPPLEFSFTEEKVVRQEMGTLIFVQNKEDAWNAFISTTDFELLSRDLRLPASALTIDPGEPMILGQYEVEEIETDDKDKDKDKKEDVPAETETIKIKDNKMELAPDIEEKIKSGDKHKFTSRFDKSTLVDVEPIPGAKIIFVLRPTLEIKIPPGMPSGSYVGELTITSL